jgi:hypothetical protein
MNQQLRCRNNLKMRICKKKNFRSFRRCSGAVYYHHVTSSMYRYVVGGRSIKERQSIVADFKILLIFLRLSHNVPSTNVLCRDLRLVQNLK